MNAQLKSYPQKILSFSLFASLMVGIFPVAHVRAELCSEPLGLVKKNLLSNLNLLGGPAPELLDEVKSILARPADVQEQESCLQTCRKSSGAPEKCPNICENENAAINVSDAAQRLVSQLKISDLIEGPAENFFASFFMEAPTLETLSWGYEISITDPFDKHPHAISWVTRERYMLAYSPGKTWTLARCTTHSLANCQPELIEPNVLEALKHCP